MTEMKSIVVHTPTHKHFYLHCILYYIFLPSYLQLAFKIMPWISILLFITVYEKVWSRISVYWE